MRGTDTGVWNRPWEMLQSYWSGYVDLVSPSDMPLVCQDRKRNCMFRLIALGEHAERVKGFMCIEAFCLGRPYDRCYIIWDADAWSRKLDFELWQRRKHACCLQRGHNPTVIVFCQREEGPYCVSTQCVYSGMNVFDLSGCQRLLSSHKAVMHS